MRPICVVLAVLCAAALEGWADELPPGVVVSGQAYVSLGLGYHWAGLFSASGTLANDPEDLLYASPNNS